MSLLESLDHFRHLDPPALPHLNRLASAAARVLARWPDVVRDTADGDREALVQLILGRVVTDRWEGAKLSSVTAAARIAFEPEFRDRPDLEVLRRFYVEETRVSDRPGFLAAMVSVYIRSYHPSAMHTRDLAVALDAAKTRLGARWRNLYAQLPELFNPVRAPEALGLRMEAMTAPFPELKAMGIALPHAPGLMDHAHLAWLRQIAPRLNEMETVDRLLDWLKPEGQTAKASGTHEAIEALLQPWLTAEAPEKMRIHLTESLIALYGDPRLSGASRWSGVSQRHRDLILRWLTKADMSFFIGVVDDTQDSHMWKPRRDFWVKLYQRGRIDAAWVAFCKPAADYARRNLVHRRTAGLDRRFGRQTAGGTRADTSLLIMKIGRKIVVDGCHNYRTHIFDETDPAAPRLFQDRYDCDDIMRRSRLAKSHASIDSWMRWVEMNT